MINELRTIYNLFPRRVFTSHSWEVKSFSEFMNVVSEYISYSRVSSSIYNYHEPENEITIDRVVFDLDSDRSHSETIKLHEYLLDKNIKHFIVFSGTNFHVYAKLSGVPVLKKDCIRNISLEVEKQLDIENDQSVRGNLHHNLAIPYTFNFKKMRYLRLLTDKELYLQYPEICNLAKKQGGKLEMYGEDGFQVEEFDFPSHNSFVFDKFEGRLPTGINENILRDLPSKCKSYMIDPELEHHKRIRLICWLMEFGLSKEQTIEILKKCLSPRKFRHCVFEEHQVETLYKGKYSILER